MNQKLRIGIIGHGFVGKATDWGFNKNVEKFIVDPLYATTIAQLGEFQPKVVFVCVPTPMEADGSQDSEIIVRVIKELAIECKKTIIVIKSTVLPSVLKKLHSLEKRLIYNPEFLREKHANQDFKNSQMLIFGGDRDLASKVSQYYLNNSRCKTKKHIFLDLISASLVKYSINTFLATKVTFFNELHELFSRMKTNDSWESIISAISNDKRIGMSHMNVPGHDGKKGFGGACFPKDSSALINYANNLKSELSVLKSAVKKNNSIRRDYKDLDKREREQNVSFNDKI
tara:strand:+ start:1007 stop:1864 length:858 start_codon:yes stop_codon:yes gene_type:complete